MSNQVNQRGAALAISLIVLLVLTLMVVSTSQNVVLQEKMSAAVMDSHASLSLAETGANSASDFIEALTGVSDFDANGTNGLYSLGDGPADVLDSANWQNGKVKIVTNDSGDEVSRYYIEHLGFFPDVQESESDSLNIMGYGETTGSGDVTGFKIVSRAMGISGKAERVVVSYYGKRL